MRVGALIAVMLLAGCDRTVNTFEVHAPGANSAELRVCGRTISLERSGDRFAATRNNCGDDGPVVTVRYSNHPSVRRPEVYTTSDIVQRFRFEVANGQCDLS